MFLYGTLLLVTKKPINTHYKKNIREAHKTHVKICKTRFSHGLSHNTTKCLSLFAIFLVSFAVVWVHLIIFHSYTVFFVCSRVNLDFNILTPFSSSLLFTVANQVFSEFRQSY